MTLVKRKKERKKEKHRGWTFALAKVKFAEHFQDIWLNSHANKGSKCLITVLFLLVWILMLASVKLWADLNLSSMS